MPSNWKTISVFNPPDGFDFPRVPACYVVYLEGRLAYVGSTQNLDGRLNKHFSPHRYSAWIDTPWGRFINIVVKYKPTRKFGDWAMIELRLIRRLDPPENIRSSPDPANRSARRRASERADVVSVSPGRLGRHRAAAPDDIK